MAPNTAPLFTLTPKIGMGQVTVANTNRDGTGTLVSIITGGTNGTRVDHVTMKATGTTAAGMLRLFIYDGVSVTELHYEQPTIGITPTGTIAAENYTWIPPGGNGLVLPSGYILKAAPNNAETWNFQAHAGDY